MEGFARWPRVIICSLLVVLLICTANIACIVSAEDRLRVHGVSVGLFSRIIIATWSRHLVDLVIIVSIVLLFIFGCIRQILLVSVFYSTVIVCGISVVIRGVPLLLAMSRMCPFHIAISRPLIVLASATICRLVIFAVIVGYRHC